MLRFERPVDPQNEADLESSTEFQELSGIHAVPLWLTQEQFIFDWGLHEYSSIHCQLRGNISVHKGDLFGLDKHLQLRIHIDIKSSLLHKKYACKQQ